MTSKTPTAIAFGEYRLDAENRLTRAGRPVSLPPKESAVLRVLMERHGRLVSKGELFERVWPGVIPSDESLTRCIYALRHALNDVRKPHRFIETFHGRGYRFVGEVRPAAERKRSVPWLERALDASPRVVEAFMHARAIWHRRSARGIQGGITMLKQALEWDPNYAPGHAALGALYTMIAWWGQGWPRELGPMITATASRALELDPYNAAAMSTLAYVRSLIDWRPDDGDRLFEEAIATDSTSPIVPSLRAYHLAAQGRFHEAVESAAAALNLDPFSLALNSGFGATLWISRRYPEALEAARRTVELDPSHGPGYGQLALAHHGLGHRDDALAAARKWAALTPDAPDARGGLAYALAVSGHRTEAAALLERARDEASTRYIVPSTFAAAALAIGGAKDAFAWLDLAVEQRCCFLAITLVDPRLDAIRDDARFRRLVAMVRGDAMPEATRSARPVGATASSTAAR